MNRHVRYITTGTVNTKEEKSIDMFYNDVEQCERLSPEALLEHFRQLRENDYRIWKVLFGETAISLKRVLSEDIPQCDRGRYRHKVSYKESFNAENIERLESLLVDTQEPSCRVTEELQEAFARELTLSIDGDRKARNFLTRKVTEDALRRELGCLLEEEKKLIDQIFQATVRLAIKAAASYYGRYQLKLHLGYADILQNASIGLLRAINTYNPERNILFSTYATFWIMRHMIRAYRTAGQLVRMPNNLYGLKKAVDKCRSDFLLLYNRMPTDPEILEELHDFQSEGKTATQERLLLLKKGQRELCSLQENIRVSGRHKDDTLPSIQDTLEGGHPDPETGHKYRKLLDTLQRVVKEEASLTEKERQYVQSYYLEGETSLSQLGEKAGCSRQSIHSHIVSALTKIRQALQREGWGKNETLALLSDVHTPRFKERQL